MRLDQFIFKEGHTDSRQKAQALIMAGDVFINGEPATKAGMTVPKEAEVTVRKPDNPYVSRGGLKLAKAIDVFNIQLKDLICLDVGASSGGFTDCMLQNGAKRVYAVDVGYGQLDWKLRNNPHVVVMERTNFRYAEPQNFKDDIQFFSIDVSFISLKHMFPALVPLLAPQASGVCLVKPQFEAGRAQVGKRGVVRDASTHLNVLKQVREYALQSNLYPIKADFSPITGPEGNIEYLYYLTSDEAKAKHIITDKQLQQTVAMSHDKLK